MDNNQPSDITADLTDKQLIACYREAKNRAYDKPGACLHDGQCAGCRAVATLAREGWRPIPKDEGAAISLFERRSNPCPLVPSAENELQKVYRRLHELASKMKDLGVKSKSYEVLYEAAVIIERQISSNPFEPAVDGEIEKLARWVEVRGELACDPQYDINFKRIAALLRQQQTPAPVRASERPWEREGWLHPQGQWCWYWNKRASGWDHRVGLLLSVEDDTLLLPYWAIPDPSIPAAS